MSESFKTEKYEDRPSSKLGVVNYFKDHMVWALLPFIGFGAGLGLRKLIKLPMLEMPGNPLSFLMSKEAKAEALKEVNKAAGYIPRRAEMAGLSLGGVYGTFRLWRGNTKQQMEVDHVAQAVTELRGIESGNQFLQAENAHLKQQMRFTDRHQPRTMPANEPRHASHVQAVVAKPENGGHIAL